MTDFSLDDLLTLVQTAAIIVALFLTLYYSRRQARAFAVDLETRILSEIHGRFERIGDIFLERPELIRSIYQSSETPSADVPLAYYILFFCAHIYHMRQRGVLADNEWTGWLHWMKNAFRLGTIGAAWKDQQMESWFDPAFQRFVDQELMVEFTRKN
jgi:hypothetical protein